MDVIAWKLDFYQQSGMYRNELVPDLKVGYECKEVGNGQDIVTPKTVLRVVRLASREVGCSGGGNLDSSNIN
eukprot:6535681-Karenia_brevis.AAC.1